MTGYDPIRPAEGVMVIALWLAGKQLRARVQIPSPSLCRLCFLVPPRQRERPGLRNELPPPALFSPCNMCESARTCAHTRVPGCVRMRVSA